MDGFKSIDEAAAWLAFLRIPTTNIRLLHSLLGIFQSPHLLFKADAFEFSDLNLTDIVKNYLMQPDWRNVESDLQWIQSEGNHLLTIDDHRYPSLLKSISDPPPALFVKGNVDALQTIQVSIVGSRRPTTDGKRIARSFSRQLANLGISITSGLASGIDTSAHLGALDSDAVTLAVLGNGLGTIYPPGNRELAGRITQKGALVSEFSPDTRPVQLNFPRRNRVISGLALGTVVVEAAVKSGSLITASFALEQGREVFAVPGSIYNPVSRGCHGLIREGAKLTENIEDILVEVMPQACEKGKCRQPPAIDGKKIIELDESSKLLLDNIGSRPVSIDFLVDNTDLAVNVITSRLLDMELKGLIETRPGGKFVRA